ncbi:MAG: hypothetical protein IPG55_07370 [Saprospiraceae bacterium]|nr:hypothetical protein [Candidatus Defluviibacterium haderslevense]MBK7245938.1 hypothetical protein [Candidatus Defluviibacterium haderslevense]
MNLKKPFDILNTIKQVEAPQFLLTRVQQRIRMVEQNRWSPQLAWTLFIGLIFIMVLELSIVGKPAFVYSTEQNIVQLMNLHYDNLLYHE